MNAHHQDPAANARIAGKVIEALAKLYEAKAIISELHLKAAGSGSLDASRESPWFLSELTQIGFAVEGVRLCLDKVTRAGIVFPLEQDPLSEIAKELENINEKLVLRLHNQ